MIPAPKTNRRPEVGRGAASDSGGIAGSAPRRRAPATSPTDPIAASTPAASQIVPWRTKTTVQATKSAAIAKARLAELERRRNERASSRPGSEHERGRHREPQVLADHESREPTSPEARKRAPSR